MIDSIDLQGAELGQYIILQLTNVVLCGEFQMRALCIPLLTAAAVSAAVPALAEPSTTRIETRPFYGATVTLEAGVRVFRPLPPHDRVIINPNGKTPLHLGFEDNTWTSHNHNYNYNSDAGRSESVAPAGGFVGDGFVGHRRPSHHGKGRGGAAR